MNKRVVVFGRGFLGHNIINSLLLQGFFVTAISRETSNEFNHPNLKHYKTDLLKDDISISDFDGVQAIVYAVSLNVPGIVADRQTIEREISMFDKVLNLAIQLPKSRLIFISSASVYSETKGDCSSENDPTSHNNLYASMKIQMEDQAMEYVNSHQLNLHILRVANVYGPYQTKQGILAKILNGYFNGTEVKILNNGLTIRDFLYIDDLSQIIVMLIESTTKDILFNISSGKGISINKLIDHLGLFIPDIHDCLSIETEIEPISRNILCTSKIRTTFPSWNITPMEDGLLETIQWWRAHSKQ